MVKWAVCANSDSSHTGHREAPSKHSLDSTTANNSLSPPRNCLQGFYTHLGAYEVGQTGTVPPISQMGKLRLKDEK